MISSANTSAELAKHLSYLEAEYAAALAAPLSRKRALLVALLVDAFADRLFVASGAFWAAGAEVAGVWVCWVCLGAFVVEFGDCANAAVAKTMPTAVVMRKRVFI